MRVYWGSNLNTSEKIAIYGAGGSAREVAWLLDASARYQNLDLVGFVQDGAASGATLNGLSVFTLPGLYEQHPQVRLCVAVGAPKTRRQLVEKARSSGIEFITLVDDSVHMSQSVNVGEGSIIACGSILTVDVVLGAHVHVNIGCTVSHDVRIGDYSTLSPGVHLAGNVHVGTGVFLGVGANIINGTSEEPLVVGDGSVIAAGACVTGHVDSDSLYAGVPAVRKKSLR